MKIISGHSHVKVGQFANARDELTLTDDSMVKRSNQIVIPASLRKRTIKIAVVIKG